MIRLLLFLIIGASLRGQCQQFVQRHDIALADSLVSADARFADVNNDGLLDIILITKTATGSAYLLMIKGDTINTPALLPSVLSLGKNVQGYIWTDYDHDNAIDLVLSSDVNMNYTARVYLNKSDFTFVEKSLDASPFEIINVADLDNDGKAEWIVSGEDAGKGFLKILTQTGTFTWAAVNDSIKIHASSIQVLDVNEDGYHDLFVTGSSTTGEYVNEFLINNYPFYFKPYLPGTLRGSTSIGDSNADGKFDVLLSGSEKNGTFKSLWFESSSSGYMAKDLAESLDSSSTFAADFNSDGIIDVCFFGKRNTADTVNYIDYPGDIESLPSRGVAVQQFGDSDYDGDLDLVQVMMHDAIHIQLFENTVDDINRGPGRPKNGVAIDIFDRTFFYWERPLDDHTQPISLTYDLHIEGDPHYQSGSFDLANERRLKPAHGNNGTENFRLIRNEDHNLVTFAVQSIDNALHSSGLCLGSSTKCVNVINESVLLCSNEEITLTADADALWFSFADGFLKRGATYDFADSPGDTVFAYNPTKIGCDGLKLWTITVEDDTIRVEESDRFACEGDELTFSVEVGWEQIQWSSLLKGDLGSATSLHYTVTTADSLTVTLSNSRGCVVKRRTAVKISKPAIAVENESYRIIRGSDVQLNVSGGDHYEWSPVSGLSQSTISNPIASPLTSTVYTVTAFDSLGCQATKQVSVVVDEGGFIPSLFTPNEDGKNDDLRIYGLPSARNFSLSVYNREGALVYKTSSLADALQRGWDGTKNGSKQPPGVYFWKVKGEVSTGESILLNGKSSGSVVLVR